MKKVMMLLLVVLLVACAKNPSFDDAIIKINDINSKYGTTMESYPASVEIVEQMISEFKQIKTMRISSNQEDFDDIVDYRIASLEAGKLYLRGIRFGSVATTTSGFACKPRTLIIESGQLRNQSAHKSYEAVNILRNVLARNPKIESLGVSEKTALFQNATAYRLEESAIRDIKVIMNSCTENRSLELYKEEIKGKMNLSEDYINNLGYDEATILWRQLRGYD